MITLQGHVVHRKVRIHNMNKKGWLTDPTSRTSWVTKRVRGMFIHFLVSSGNLWFPLSSVLCVFCTSGEDVFLICSCLVWLCVFLSVCSVLRATVERGLYEYKVHMNIDRKADSVMGWEESPPQLLWTRSSLGENRHARHIWQSSIPILIYSSPNINMKKFIIWMHCVSNISIWQSKY